MNGKKNNIYCKMSQRDLSIKAGINFRERERAGSVGPFDGVYLASTSC